MGIPGGRLVFSPSKFQCISESSCSAQYVMAIAHIASALPVLKPI